MYRHHSFDERLEIVRRILSGKPIGQVCREYSIDRNQVRQWLLRYNARGEDGLRRRNGHHVLEAAKIESIVRDFLEKRVPLHDLSLKYDVNRSSIGRWVSQVREHGYESLHVKKRLGRPPKEDMGRPRKKTYEEMTELEKLQYENMVLRAENALLKKLKALAEEEEARKRSIWPKPSTD